MVSTPQVDSPFGPLHFFAQADQMTVAEAEAFARRMSRYELSSKSAEIAKASRTTMDDFFSLLPGSVGYDFDPHATWAAWPAARRLEAPIGKRQDGSPMVMNLRHSSEDEPESGNLRAMPGYSGVRAGGPHVTMAGITGSGKSKTFHSIVLNYAARYSPEQVQFILADFKGGVELKPLERLPHVHGVLSNETSDTTFMSRFIDILMGEVEKRFALLNAAGVADTVKYELARRAGAALPPIPALILIVDEVNTMLKNHEAYADAFDEWARQGRALDCHMILGGQSMNLSKMTSVLNNTHTKIALRCSVDDSRTQLGNPIASEIKEGEFGVAYTLEEGTMVRWRSLHVGAPYRPQVRAARRGPAEVPVLEVTGPRLLTIDDDELPPIAEMPDRVESDAAEEVEQERTLQEYVIDKLVEAGGDVGRRIWIEPLQAVGRACLSDLVDEVLQEKYQDPGATWQNRYGHAKLADGLWAISGRVDMTRQHKHETVVQDLGQQGGFVSVSGGAQAGKTVTLQNLLLSLAMQFTPEQVQFFGLGAAVVGVESLGHVAGSALIKDTEGAMRVLDTVRELVRERTRLFARNRIASVEQFRREFDAGTLKFSDGYGEVFFVVDTYDEFEREYQSQMDSFNDLLESASAVGVHVLTASGGNLRPKVAGRFSYRIEMRVQDPISSSWRKQAAIVPENYPGSGVLGIGEGLQFLAAEPTLHHGEPIMESLLPAINAAGSKFDSAMKVLELPSRVTRREVLALPKAAGLERWQVPMGIRQRDLGPAVWNYRDHAHLMLFGSPESGRTTALKTLAEQIMATHSPAQARFLVLDPRRTLLGVIPEDDERKYAHRYTTTAEQFGEVMREFAATILAGRRVKEAQSQRELAEGLKQPYAGPEFFIIVDDMHQLPDHYAMGPQYYLNPIIEDLPTAGQMGVHLILTSTSAAYQTIGNNPAVKKMRQSGTPAVVMSAAKYDLDIYGVRPIDLPRGRGQLLRPGSADLIQFAVPD